MKAALNPRQIGDYRDTALRMIEKPDREAFTKRFAGDLKAYTRCVCYNFADVLSKEELERYCG